ncbi:purine-cytosine permease [Secundilactobacillus odoratitofui DSM 19909 = JCM 15043]|uniref:Purine-cytosine permease n=1 Tax=Secundilactobacillus odoratitofui DSM 19909 = JCM 15043 TaxID=1423776 RepID=A0A0R1LMN8_9LACO|nr:cytosine permease [Secundilactobacillus odoratitofui]KRK97166.1 purine-cytosine permease [Secundilactobacillus odoratitofui DSM 19909 = JCM 15043]
MDQESIKVPASEKTLTPGKLFYNWFAANIGIMGFVYGAIIVSYHLSFFQAILAAFVGALSFLAPGWVAMIGQREGVTTFKLSRAAYGTHGNKIPNAIAWFNMVGWLAVNVITGTLLLVSLFKVIHVKQSFVTTAIALVIFGGLVVLSGLLKEATLAKIQTWLSWIFGLITVVILGLFLAKANWSAALSAPSGSWLKGFLPAVSIVAAGSGISWSMAAADWGAYVKPTTKPAATFWNTTMGGAVPLFVLMAGGVLLSTIEPNLAAASNPFDVMYAALPSWIGVIYFLVAAGGLIPQCIVSLRSARINLATIGIKVSQPTSLTIHSLIVILIPVYVLFISGNFLGNFEIFLSFLGICLASWVAIFLCDSQMFRRQGYALNLMTADSTVHYNWGGIVSWVLATVTGFLFTNNAVWTGPFAHGIFKDNSLGVFISGLFAIVCMLIVKAMHRSGAVQVSK